MTFLTSFLILVPTLIYMIQDFATFNGWKTHIRSNHLVPPYFNKRLRCISLNLIFFVNQLLYPLSLLDHPLIPLILYALDQFNRLSPFLQLPLHCFLPITAIVSPHLDMILVECMLHVLMFFLWCENTRLGGGAFLTTLLYGRNFIIGWTTLIWCNVVKFRFK